jgi:nucleotide-binding universal stress UspA family protein
MMVAFSGPQGARSVADELRRIGLPDHSEVLFAVPRNMMPLPPSLRRRGRSATSQFVTVQELRSSSLFANEAARVAEAWSADLLLVGSNGSPTVDPPYFSCSAPSVAALASCSVRVARPRSHAAAATPRLLVGVDGSNGAGVAIREVERRAWPRGTAVRLVSVDARGGAASRAEATLRAAGLEVSVELRRGDPVDEIVRAAVAWEANCIVVGANGDGVAQGRLGAVADGLVRRAPLSVEIVRERAPVSRFGRSSPATFETSGVDG